MLKVSNEHMIYRFPGKIGNSDRIFQFLFHLKTLGIIRCSRSFSANPISPGETRAISSNLVQNP